MLLNPNGQFDRVAKPGVETSIVLCKTHCNFLAPIRACSPTFRGDHEHTTINAVTTLVLEVIVLLSHPK
jgi:hypothetical protein